jgi:hypothetical protein
MVRCDVELLLNCSRVHLEGIRQSLRKDHEGTSHFCQILGLGQALNLCPVVLVLTNSQNSPVASLVPEGGMQPTRRISKLKIVMDRLHRLKVTVLTHFSHLHIKQWRHFKVNQFTQYPWKQLKSLLEIDHNLRVIKKDNFELHSCAEFQVFHNFSNCCLCAYSCSFQPIFQIRNQSDGTGVTMKKLGLTLNLARFEGKNRLKNTLSF